MPVPVRHPSPRRFSRAAARARPAPPPAVSFKQVELAQRGRMILDVAELDLAAAEERLGPFHDTSWHFRRALADARTSWDRLRIQYGLAVLEAALDEPPATVLTLGRPDRDEPAAVLIVIAGHSYALRRQPDTADAPRIWRLLRLPDPGDGPFHACRLADGSTQCDCAEWTYQIAGLSDSLCKHLAALDALGWL
ncbi:hypothetical protein [Tautonia sociabilis]|uniref:hypothetical protein n=1 Tax=Tautonia sociabilis TaxID=2080755 RepID=UPI0018F48B7A|nr:hypothetical protein [Tautonia sociabilis]